MAQVPHGTPKPEINLGLSRVCLIVGIWQWLPGEPSGSSVLKRGCCLGKLRHLTVHRPSRISQYDLSPCLVPTGLRILQTLLGNNIKKTPGPQWTIIAPTGKGAWRRLPPSSSGLVSGQYHCYAHLLSQKCPLGCDYGLTNMPMVSHFTPLPKFLPSPNSPTAMANNLKQPTHSCRLTVERSRRKGEVGMMIIG